MSKKGSKTRKAPLDTGSVVAAEHPWRDHESLTGTRESRFQCVYKRSVLNQVHAHGQSSREAEVCGVLVGNVFRDGQGPYLLIEASIRGDQAQGRAAQVTFKAETWTHIQNVMEKEHADAKIVGWYHTHPSFGIFLSGMDLFIQDNFFNLPWQVAFVYDPIGGDEGSFVWRAGKADREPFLVQEDEPEVPDTSTEIAAAALQASESRAKLVEVPDLKICFATGLAFVGGLAATIAIQRGLADPVISAVTRALGR